MRVGSGSWWSRLVAFFGSLPVPTLKAIVAVGLLVRVALWAVSQGSNDIRYWAVYGDEILRRGVLAEYVANVNFNHPPLMGLWAELCAYLGHHTPVPFAQWFKLLPLGADLIAVPLLVAALKRKGASEVGAWRAAAVFATSLGSIWITSHHGNTDAACGLLAFAGISLLDDRRPFLGGFVFALALNVKLLPLVIVPGLFAWQTRDLKAAVWFCVGLGVGLSPFLFPAIAVGPSFYKNAIAYTPSTNRWGFRYFFAGLTTFPSMAHDAKVASIFWLSAARYVMMGTSLLFGIIARFKKWSALTVGALVFAEFFVFTPGMGVQYFAYPVLTLCAVDVRRAFLYSITNGAFVSAIYLSFARWRIPFVTIHQNPIPQSAGFIGVVSYVVLLEFIASRFRPLRRPAFLRRKPATRMTRAPGDGSAPTGQGDGSRRSPSPSGP